MSPRQKLASECRGDVTLGLGFFGKKIFRIAILLFIRKHLINFSMRQCGQPYEQYNCPECNAVIGGMNHVLQAGNTAAQRYLCSIQYIAICSLENSIYIINTSRSFN